MESKRNDTFINNNPDNNEIGDGKNENFIIKTFTNKNNNTSNINNIFTNNNTNEIKLVTKNKKNSLNSSSVTEDLDQSQNIKNLINPQIINIIPNASGISALDENINGLQVNKIYTEHTKDLLFSKLVENSNNFKKIDNSTIIVCTEKSGIPRLLLSEHNQSKNNQLNNLSRLPSNSVCKLPLNTTKTQTTKKTNNKTSLDSFWPVNSISNNLPSKTRILQSKSPIVHNKTSRNLLLKHNDDIIPSYARKKSLQSRYHQSCQN